jgi:membrane fusion protein, multidrug efflux system
MKNIIVTLFALSLSACGNSQAPPPNQPTEVSVVALTAQTLNLTTELPGRTAASMSAEIRPQVSGIIQKRFFEEGAFVKAGQLLYQIDPSTYQATYNQAKAALLNVEATVATAKLKSERYEELVAIQGISKQDAADAKVAYQQALANVAQSRATLESAAINLNFTKVKSPISGFIGTSAFTQGALVTANQTDALAVVRSLSPIFVDLTESSTALLKHKQMAATQSKTNSTLVQLKLEDGSTYPLTGTLKFSEVSVDESTGMVKLRAEFNNPNHLLLPGMYVHAVLNDETLDNAILAPQQGIIRDNSGETRALLVDANHKVIEKKITVGRAIGNQWLVLDGLTANDVLMVEGINKVHAGDTVKPIVIAEKGDLSTASPQAKNNVKAKGE